MPTTMKLREKSGDDEYVVEEERQVDLGDILDANGNELLEFDTVTSAVNFLRLSNSIASAAPILSAQGDDTNIGITLTPKGTGTLTLNSGATTTVMFDMVGAALTTGKGIDLSDLAAITTGKAIHVDATGITHTDGILVHIDSAGTVITSTGRLFLSDHTGVTTTSGILNEFKSTANDETVVLKLTAASLTTGTVLQATGLDALTSGIGVSVSSGATAITGAGRLVYVNHSGVSSTSGVLSEFTSAAADETVVFRITASAALAAGVLLDLSGAAVTTGTILDIGGLDALTTGGAVLVSSNSSDTGTRSLVSIVNDNTAATGTKPLAIQNDATAGAHIVLTGTGILGIDFTALSGADCLFNATAGAGCTAAPQTNAAVGFLNIKVAGTDQWIPYYNAT